MLRHFVSLHGCRPKSIGIAKRKIKKMKTAVSQPRIKSKQKGCKLSLFSEIAQFKSINRESIIGFDILSDINDNGTKICSLNGPEEISPIRTRMKKPRGLLGKESKMKQRREDSEAFDVMSDDLLVSSSSFSNLEVLIKKDTNGRIHENTTTVDQKKQPGFKTTSLFYKASRNKGFIHTKTQPPLRKEGTNMAQSDYVNSMFFSHSPKPAPVKKSSNLLGQLYKMTKRRVTANGKIRQQVLKSNPSAKQPLEMCIEGLQLITPQIGLKADQGKQN